MVERLVPSPLLEQEASGNGDGRVLFKIGDLPKTRGQLLKSLFVSPLDLPFDL